MPATFISSLLTINEREFNKLCKDSQAVIKRSTKQTERYAVLVEAVFPRLCAFLELDPEQQRNELRGELQDDYGFFVSQIIEEHMKPAFDYSIVLKAYV
ncbi:MAG: hypothetical protein H0X02_12660 [Nitrosomonas sp.]|nr:hypothetical protein [Nitrosomonas sp.]